MQPLQMVCNTNISVTKGVHLLSPVTNSDFEKQYTAVRNREKRLLSDEQLRKLPNTQKSDIHHNEWDIRQKSSHRIVEYLQKKEPHSRKWILDIGCGNGWFSNLLATIINSNILAIDINMTELMQAATVFTKANLWFAYLDIFSNTLKDNSFNIIILNSCIQYFPNPLVLIQRCQNLLTDGGEIHIVDSPFYAKEDVTSAKERTKAYYQSLGFKGMSQFYHHHCYSLFESFNATFLYQPVKKNKQTTSDSKKRDSPFLWTKLSK